MYVIGVDVGTTGTKALLLDSKGRICKRGYHGYGTITGPGGMVEQRAEDWWEAAALAIRQASEGIEKKEITALALSTQGASSVLMDKEFHTLGNAITWMDTRAQREMEVLSSEREEGYYYRTTGWEISPSLDACKLAWLKKNKPKEMGQAYKFLSTLEYMNYCLTGNYVTDPTNAAIRQMMDIHVQRWDEKILEDIGVEEALLPKIEPAGADLGVLTREAARSLGLSAETKVYNGAHDQYCCALGSGSVENGDLLLGTGTAWAVMSITETPLITKSKIAFAKHVVPGLWGALTSVPFGGVSLDWFKNQVAGCSYPDIAEGVRRRMGVEEKLFFFPYFNGAAGPVRDEKLRGTFTGLELGHDRFHMAAAVMEGVVFHTAMILADYKENGALLQKLRVMGGALNSQEWMNMMGGVFDCEILALGEKDAAALGAAMIAAVGSGWFEDYRQAAEVMVLFEKVPQAPQKRRDFYHRKMEVYLEKWNKVQMIYREGE